jgi:hypothetical protein
MYGEGVGEQGAGGNVAALDGGEKRKWVKLGNKHLYYL